MVAGDRGRRRRSVLHLSVKVLRMVNMVTVARSSDQEIVGRHEVVIGQNVSKVRAHSWLTQQQSLLASLFLSAFFQLSFSFLSRQSN